MRTKLLNLAILPSIFLGIFLIFNACSENKEQGKYAKLVSIIEQIQSDANSVDKNMDMSLVDDAFALDSRAKSSGYKLISPKELNEINNEEIVIIASVPRGIYNLGLIPNAKNFEFAKSPSVNDDGSEWNWQADALNREQSEFIEFLGNDKDKKIIFYDSGEDIISPIGSAHIGLMWAKQLGYNNLYRLIGGMEAWREFNLPITTQMPSCCQH